MSDLVLLLPASVCLWALWTQAYSRMLVWCGAALFPVAVHALHQAHFQDAPRVFLPVGLILAVFAGMALRWRNRHDGDADVSPRAILRLLAVLWGVLGALALFRLAVVFAQGTGQAVLWHGALRAGRLAALALALWRKAPWLLASGGTVLLGLTLASALLLPARLAALAAGQAKGQPFCLLGPETGLDDDQPRRSPYRLTDAPREWADLTFLTLPRPLTLAVMVAVPDPDPAFPDRQIVIAAHDWSDRALAFQPSDDTDLRKAGASALLDCAPSQDPFAQIPDTGLVQAVVLYRPRLSGDVSGDVWGLPLTDHYRLPPAAAPTYDGRFRRGEIAFEAELIPGAGRFRMTITYTPFPQDFLVRVFESRVRDRDAPLDFAALAVNAFGLHAYEHPSSSDETAIEGTYVAYHPDGSPVTAIACDRQSCRHSFRPMPTDRPALWVATVVYAPGHLADWRAV